MDDARFLVAVLSPLAAQSKWVNKEIGYWLAHREQSRLLLVVAAGTLQWDEAERRFDPSACDAAPPVLAEPGVLPAPPWLVGRRRRRTVGPALAGVAREAHRIGCADSRKVSRAACPEGSR